uniref:Adrenomedullin n=1 Tax=Hippocampus comes TaxID=109280 RepID=A0A3Q2Y923_HIPCM
MRLTLRTLVCCCVLIAVMPLVRSALLGYKKTDARRILGRPPACQQELKRLHLFFCRLLLNIRRRRSPSKTSGCFLFSCSYHDLIHRLSQMHDNNKKVPNAPKDKMSSIGRRRRRGADEPTDRSVTIILPPGDCQRAVHSVYL